MSPKTPRLRIGVVGTFVRDHTIPYEGEPYDNLGGLLYTLAFLGALADKEVGILPVARVGADIFDEVLAALRRFPAISPEFLIRSDLPNTRVELHHVTPTERVEITSERMPPLQFPEVEPLVACDAVLVNMITGTDISLEAFRHLSSSARGWIYLDFHSLAYELDENGRRRLARPKDWLEWVAGARVVQVNEGEACALAGIHEKEVGVRRFAEQALAVGVEVCNVTAGARGSYLALRRNGELGVQRIPAVRPPRIVDVVGCGDAFAAGFVYGYATGADAVEAARLANRVAAANCAYPGTSGVQDLPEIIRHLDDAG